MEAEEAKKYILQNWFDGDEAPYGVDGNAETMAMKVAVEALEKQIPKKPLKEVTENVFRGYSYIGYICPACKSFITDCCEENYFNHCDACGQAIDWSDEE